MGKRKTIVCLETGKQFNSVENAANAIGVSSGFISRQIKAGKPIKGFYYYYAGEMLPDEFQGVQSLHPRFSILFKSRARPT